MILRRNIVFVLMALLMSMQVTAETTSEHQKQDSKELKDTLSLHQVYQQLEHAQQDVIISNKTIAPGKKDGTFLNDQVFFKEYHLKAPNSSERRLFFYDCDFVIPPDTPLFLDNWHFKKLNFVGCTFQMPLFLFGCTFNESYPLVLENCTFRNLFSISGEGNLSDLEVNGCTFEGQLLVKSNVNNLTLNHCRFDADTNFFKSLDEEKTHYQLSAKNIQIGEMDMQHCLLLNHGISNLFSIDLSGSEIQKINWMNNQMTALNFTDAEVSKSILIDSLSVSKYIGVQNFDFPDANTNIPWNNLEGQKLALFQTGLSDRIVPYQAKTKQQLSKTILYNELVSVYKKLNTLYQDRGDLPSANGSYIEIKELETAHLEYIQSVHPSSTNLINILLNKVMKFFSDYATNPGKSVNRAWQFLLLFTVLYMFTFSKWDGMNYGYCVRQFQFFFNYIQSDKNIQDVFEEEKDKTDKLVNNLKKDYLKKQKKVPRTITMVGEVIYALGRVRSFLTPRLIRLLNFQPQSWENLKSFKKFFSYLMIPLVMLLFIVYVLVVKFITGFIMSLNNLIALGFGVMPEEGIAMYISIIEGIIGWFLLTIFTVSLFSQVLQ
ncbi:MAG: hypothetical protein JXR71_01420 [Bacteroidales bacterium]|nr:hypothetical protein [Bacteroidales bacterium]